MSPLVVATVTIGRLLEFLGLRGEGIAEPSCALADRATC